MKGVFYRTTIYSKMPLCEPYTLDQTTLERAKEWVEFESKCAYNSGATIDKYTRIGNAWNIERVLTVGEIESPE